MSVLYVSPCNLCCMQNGFLARSTGRKFKLEKYRFQGHVLHLPNNLSFNNLIKEEDFQLGTPSVLKFVRARIEKERGFIEILETKKAD